MCVCAALVSGSDLLFGRIPPGFVDFSLLISRIQTAIGTRIKGFVIKRRKKGRGRTSYWVLLLFSQIPRAFRTGQVILGEEGVYIYVFRKEAAAGWEQRESTSSLQGGRRREGNISFPIPPHFFPVRIKHWPVGEKRDNFPNLKYMVLSKIFPSICKFTFCHFHDSFGKKWWRICVSSSSREKKEERKYGRRTWDSQGFPLPSPHFSAAAATDPKRRRRRRRGDDMP